MSRLSLLCGNDLLNWSEAAAEINTVFSFHASSEKALLLFRSRMYMISQISMSRANLSNSLLHFLAMAMHAHGKGQ